MSIIFLGLACLLLLVNLAGVSALAGRLIPGAASARALLLLVGLLLLFAVEHAQGLGALHWVWPFSTAAALWLLYRYRDWRAHRLFWLGELVFVAGFAYGLLWRFALPDIGVSSEQLVDLYFISNYQSGVTLPPPDLWLAGGLFDFYYGFQHYAAALIARLLDLPAGYAMNLAWAVLIGLLVSLAWEIGTTLGLARRWRLLLLAVLLVGGNGLSAFMPWLISAPQNSAHEQAVQRLWASTRFAGLYENYVDTPAGEWLVQGSQQRELPLETLAYLSMLGDYHPPLGGFLILLLSLALMVFLYSGQSPPAQRWAWFGLGLSPALMWVTNTWVLPLQAALLLSWVLFRWRQVDWRGLLAGGAFGPFMILPFLAYFATASLDTPIRWVAESDRTPWRLFLAMHWPTLLWIGLGLLLWRRQPWLAWLALTVALLLGVSELVFVDDPSNGKYQRFNTTLKWWSWLWPLAIFGLAAGLMAAGLRWLRMVVALSLLPLLIYGFDLGRYAWTAPAEQRGRMAGDGWLVKDGVLKQITAYLREAPPGVVLEAMHKGAYGRGGAISTFAGQPLALGWPDHVLQWRGSPAFVQRRREDIERFYRGQMEEPLSFLEALPVRYIIWTNIEERRWPGVREMLDQQIGKRYQWLPFYRQGAEQAGIWRRVEAGR